MNFSELARKLKVQKTDISPQFVEIFPDFLYVDSTQTRNKWECSESKREKWKKVHLPHCCNQVWMKNRGLIPWNVTAICETFKISCLMEKLHTKDVLEKHLKDPIIPFGSLVEYYPISAKDQSRIHQFGKYYLDCSLDTHCTREEFGRVTYWSQTLRSWRRWTHRKSSRKDSMRKRWYFPNKENLFFQSQMDESNRLEEIGNWEHPPWYGIDQFKERVTLTFLENQKGLFHHFKTHFRMLVKREMTFGPCQETSHTCIISSCAMAKYPPILAKKVATASIWVESIVRYVHCSLVHKFIPISEAKKIPNTKAAVENISTNMEKLEARQLSETKKMIDETKNQTEKFIFNWNRNQRFTETKEGVVPKVTLWKTVLDRTWNLQNKNHHEFHLKYCRSHTEANVRHICEISGRTRWDLKFGNDWLGKTFMEISVINWQWKNHQSSTREGLRFFFFSDSVLCLGKIHQHPESNEAWKKRIEWITPS